MYNYSYKSKYARWLDDRYLIEESPGSTEEQCRITSGGGDPRESATENIPPCSIMVRVKWCGKSAPH